jgi:hypothetical protein
LSSTRYVFEREFGPILGSISPTGENSWSIEGGEPSLAMVEETSLVIEM